MSEQEHRPIHQSEILVNKAEAEKYLAERDRFAAEAEFKSLEAAGQRTSNALKEILLRGEERKEADELAKDVHNHVYVFDKEVNDTSVKSAIQQMTTWARRDTECEIELQINSPGGSIFAGLALVDFIRRLQDQGHKVNTVAFGMAASMGGVLLQVGDHRIMGKNSILLIHEGSLGAIGDFGQVEDRVELMKLFHERILDIFEERAKPLNAKTTKRFIRQNWKRKDWWLSAEEALRLGFVDEVR